jgi:hypothetical protein
MMLKRVDLPQPEGPISATNSPLSTAKETLSIAVRSAKCLVNASTASADERVLPLSSPGISGTAARIAGAGR